MDTDKTLSQISDGKRYTLHDMAKIGCHDCAGCSACCRGMGESVILDPYDVFLLTSHLHRTFEQLLADTIELHVTDGLILPNLIMRSVQAASRAADSAGAGCLIGRGDDFADGRTASAGTAGTCKDSVSGRSDDETDTACVFLGADGRCTVHAYRPGLCRIFPLGRNYDGDKLEYFVLEGACPAQNKTKIRIEKWLDTPNLKEKQRFLVAWHAFVKRLREKLAACGDNEARNVNLAFLRTFYITPYETAPGTPAASPEEFYPTFYERLQGADFA